MNDQPAQITPYCQNRARDRLGYVFLGLLLLFLGVCVAVYGVSLLGEDRSGWDYMEYVKMGVGCLGGLALVAAGVAVVELQYLAQEIINWLWLRAGVAVEQV